MKKSYSIAAAALIAAATAMGAQGAGNHFFVKKNHAIAKRGLKTDMHPFAAPARAEAVPGLWKPAKAVVSYYEDGEWIKMNQFAYTYDDRGNIVHDIDMPVDGREAEDPENAYQESVYEYNADGYWNMRTVRTGESLDKLENSEHKTRTFDAKVAGLVTEMRSYVWQNNDWTLQGNIWNRVVTRDAEGRVTKVEVMPYYNGGFPDVSQMLEITYGADGKPQDITEYSAEYDSNDALVLVEGYALRNCKWASTDCQIVDMDGVFEGANKMIGCDQYYADDLVGGMTVVYDGDTDNFISTLTDTDGYVYTQAYKDLPNGGYESDICMIYDGETEMREYSLEEYDELGNQTVVIGLTQFGEDVEVEAWSVAASVRDSENRLTQWTLRDFYPFDEEEDYEIPAKVTAKAADGASIIDSLDPENPPVEGEWEPMIRIDFSDYLNVAGIENIITDADADAPVEYFTIDGRRVTNPAAGGIYIVRQGTRVSKTIL